MFLEITKLLKKHPSQTSAVIKLLKASGMNELQARQLILRAKMAAR